MLVSIVSRGYASKIETGFSQVRKLSEKNFARSGESQGVIFWMRENWIVLKKNKGSCNQNTADEGLEEKFQVIDWSAQRCHVLMETFEQVEDVSVLGT